MRRLWPALLVPLTLSSMLLGGALAGAEDDEPLTLAVTANRETCTLGSVTTLDYDIQGGQPPYQLTVDGQPVEQSPDPHYIPCRSSRPWSRLGPPGSEDIQRMIVGVTDATGARAYAVAEHRLVPPLPAPIRLRVESGLVRSQSATLTAELGAPYRHREQRAESFAIRWRDSDSGEWQFEHFRPDEPESWTFRHSWKIETSPAGEQLELQAAQIRHAHDLEVPQALNWSEIATVVTLVPPLNLQAEASHDSITLSWGPHVEGLVYVARLQAIEADRYAQGHSRRITTGPLYEARFDDLLPDTLYRVRVALDGRGAFDQHEFELRTESAPDGWSPPSRTATDVGARIVDDGLEVTWTAPSTGSRYETTVCAQPAEHLYSQSCETVSPGESRVHLPSNWWVEGGTFAIGIETWTSPVGATEIDLHVPSYDSDLPIRGSPPRPPHFYKVSWSHLHHEDPRPATWSFRWFHQNADLAEVSWEVDGRRFVRETRTSEFSVSLAYNQIPTDFRVRLLHESAWTPWSPKAELSHLNDSYRNERLVERPDVVEVHWDVPADDSDVTGYRLYVKRNFRRAEVIDVGRQISAEIPIKSTDRDLGVNVATLYEGPLEVVHFFHNSLGLRLPPRESEPLEIRAYAQLSLCPPAGRAPMAVHWSISGGAWPFTVSVGDMLGFQTEGYSGFTIVECSTGANGMLKSIPVSVMDANGQIAHDTLGSEDVWTYKTEDGYGPFDVPFGPRSVHRDRVWLTWDNCHGRYVAALRWRVVGAETWSYQHEFPVEFHAYGGRCAGLLEGLEPLSSYEYQLARYIDPVQLRRPEQLQWSEPQLVTTLGPPQELSVTREGESVTMSWQRQPDAWAYIVGLRAEGRSWWKRHEASGEATETVRFRRVPEDVELSAHLLSPPLKHGEEEIPRDVDHRIRYGH
ncbi:MAG: fibronectin type III domain-containing protein [Chloroflexi bacterium]|nr:fibronectin type III domain-containing protein [Chloroflexota bacterium]MYF21502.1 fibronectin type III domain-containing protein [Chloroflexota bacterium]